MRGQRAYSTPLVGTMSESDPMTYKVMRTREEAVEAMRMLQKKGWEVYATNAPLSGQVGFKCLSPFKKSDGILVQHSCCIFWNLYDSELVPIVIECQNERMLLDFAWQHGHHESFGFFEYPDGDLGFVCYCQGKNGRSMVLQIDEDLDLNEDACEFIWEYQSQMKS